MLKNRNFTFFLCRIAVLGFVLAYAACSTNQNTPDSLKDLDDRNAQLVVPEAEKRRLNRNDRRMSKSALSYKMELPQKEAKRKTYEVSIPSIGSSAPTGPADNSLGIAAQLGQKGTNKGALDSVMGGHHGVAFAGRGIGGGGKMGGVQGIGRPHTKRGPQHFMMAESHQEMNTEEYAHTAESSFTSVTSKPLSTFSIDVDTGAYSNVRRFLNMGRKPPADAVRIEEMINYFEYNYPQPEGSTPFSVTTELADCPWNPHSKLAMIGIQGEEVDTDEMPPMNLVFLVDVSGSMQSARKLPLVKAGLKLLIKQMRPEDRLALVVYAGAAGVVLPSTPGSEKATMIQALERLQAGGSTAGSAGIKLAYEVARKNFLEEGNNRVILASDGDFNVGASSHGELVRLIEKEREADIFLSVLGFGMGNYKDNRMEQLANKGNGNYAYIDTILEAKKVLVTEMGGSMLTIAKDVKLQIEFNPMVVSSYRLIGYNNRRLANRDFNDDKKDAGELGAGHTVTAFYEIIPAGSEHASGDTDELRYQKVSPSDAASESGEMFTVKLRYKSPRGKKSKLISQRAVFDQETEPSENLLFASSVVEFGLLLRNSKHKEAASYQAVLSRAQDAMGEDNHGYRDEFIKLVKTAELLQ